MHYTSPKHERLYRNVARGRGYRPRTLAALFLLTAHRKLWRKWCKAIDNKGVDWAACNGLDPGWDGDALQHAALSIAKSQSPQVTLHQLGMDEDGTPKHAHKRSTATVTPKQWIANPIHQVLRYVEDIKGGKKMRANGRPFGNVANTAFYCYVIADMTDSLKQDAKFAGLRITPDGEGYFGYNPDPGAYVEVISLDKLLRDAQERNRILFDKLFTPSPLAILGPGANTEST